jgi:predicted transcriptional regulator
MLVEASSTATVTEEDCMKDKKAIKREILDKFRSMNAENQETLPLHWLELVYQKKLSADEKKLSKRAIQELISVGIVENVEGPVLNLRLTEKGQNLIYASENQKSVREQGQGGPLFQFTGTEA